MPVEVTPTATVVDTTTGPEATPAPAATEQAPVVAESLEAVKAARYDAEATAAAEATKAAEAKAAADAVAAAEAAKAKEAETATAASLATKLEELQSVNKTLTDKAKLADKLELAQSLAKAGKHYEAIQVFSDIGIDFDKAVHNVLNPGAAPESAKPAEPAAKQVDPEVAKLQEQLKQVQDRLAASDKAVADAAKEAGRRSVVDHVKAQAKDYPFLASNEAWVNQALSEAEPEYAKAVAANDGKDLTDDQKNDLIIKALAKAEAGHKSAAEAYAAVTKTKKPNDVPKVAPPVLTLAPKRAGITPVTGTSTKPATLDELKRQRRAN